jgi:hypothetical protein
VGRRINFWVVSGGSQANRLTQPKNSILAKSAEFDLIMVCIFVPDV